MALEVNGGERDEADGVGCLRRGLSIQLNIMYHQWIQLGHGFEQACALC